MTTKEQVLALLKQNASGYLSGQQIANQLYLTRAAVWKAIKALQSEGYEIAAVTNRGYCLKENTSLPDAEEIRRLLKRKWAARREVPEIIVYETVGSTNDCAREFAEQEISRCEKIVIAGTQTSGRGRRGRSFYSPGQTGMYMSFLLYPDMEFARATRLTCMMAEAICRAVEEETGIETQIKWVNDIFYKERKVAGILTEGRTSMEDGSLMYVIIGAGVNLYQPAEGFPEELKGIAGSLLSERPDAGFMNRLYAAVIDHFFRLYDDPDANAFVEGYRRRSMLIGHYVKIMGYAGSEKLPGSDYALVTGIDSDCRLQIRYDDGRTDALSSGEVSVVKY